jgi:hypothetical protein
MRHADKVSVAYGEDVAVGSAIFYDALVNLTVSGKDKSTWLFACHSRR